MRPLLETQLEDDDAEAVRKSHALAIVELQTMPAASLRVISGVELPDSTVINVAHKLGRAPLACWVSPVRTGAAITVGFVIQYTGSHPSTGRAIDGSRILVLAAFGFGATVTVDVFVVGG